MRVLVVHNAYRAPGGEDAVVQAEAALLRSHGHPVTLLARHNDELSTATPLDKLQAAGRALWSRDSARRLGASVARDRPQVVHVHNTWPLISPSIYWACAQAGVPVVQTLHNFRLACPQAMFLRDGRACTDCLGRLPWPAVAHGCYRGSRAQTAVLAGTLVLHRALGTWRHKVARYIALNEFCRQQLVAAGLPAERVVIKPHFCAEPPPPGNHQPVARQGLLYVGRLAPEKGVATLLQALRMLQAAPPDAGAGASASAGAGAGAGAAMLRVVGDGPGMPALRESAAGMAGVQWLGRLDADGVRAEMSRAAALVLPSECHESFPRVLVEAGACGLPVIASAQGALTELVHEGRTGWLFAPGDVAALAERLRWALARPQALATMGQAARVEYQSRYTPERNLARLLAIYAEAGAKDTTLRDAAKAPPASR